MKYDFELNELINKSIDKKYAEFHGKLVPNTTIRGVRIPVLRQIAKQFSQYDDFLENVSLNNYESISVACYYVGITTKDVLTLKKRVEYLLPHIDNWAVCDTFVSSLKVLKKQKQKDEFLSTLLTYLNSDNDFTVRFAIVCLLDYYVQDDLTDDLLNKMLSLQGRDYYVDMAIAWFVSVAFVNCRDKTLKFLQQKKLNNNVQNLSISKICDSFRVSSDDKQIVKQLKCK